MQEYGEIRKDIGSRKYDAIELYLKEICPQEQVNKNDFSFDFEGIQHFYNTTKLTINLVDGEFFNKESEEKQIFIKTSHLDKIYELKI